MDRKNFVSRFLEKSETRSPLCVGIDPSPQVLSRWSLPDSASGALKFSELLIDAAKDTAVAVKPQAAWFERLGPDGAAVLADVVARAREVGLLTILDAKRGDIGHTCRAYAEAYLSANSKCRVDAITANAYLGLDSLTPLFQEAADNGAYVFVVVVSSNPEGWVLQNAKIEDGRTISEALADGIADINMRFEPSFGPVGAVVGATSGDNRHAITSRLPHSLILCPGIGSQGGKAATKAFAYPEQVIASVSRGVYEEGGDIARIRRKIQYYANLVRPVDNEYLNSDHAV